MFYKYLLRAYCVLLLFKQWRYNGDESKETDYTGFGRQQCKVLCRWIKLGSGAESKGGKMRLIWAESERSEREPHAGPENASPTCEALKVAHGRLQTSQRARVAGTWMSEEKCKGRICKVARNQTSGRPAGPGAALGFTLGERRRLGGQSREESRPDLHLVMLLGQQHSRKKILQESFFLIYKNNGLYSLAFSFISESVSITCFRPALSKRNIMWGTYVI